MLASQHFRNSRVTADSLRDRRRFCPFVTFFGPRIHAILALAPPERNATESISLFEFSRCKRARLRLRCDRENLIWCCQLRWYGSPALWVLPRPRYRKE